MLSVLHNYRFFGGRQLTVVARQHPFINIGRFRADSTGITVGGPAQFAVGKLVAATLAGAIIAV
jgi:hypothetical protein